MFDLDIYVCPQTVTWMTLTWPTVEMEVGVVTGTCSMEQMSPPVSSRDGRPSPTLQNMSYNYINH